MPEPSKGIGPSDIESQLANQTGRRNYLLVIAIDSYEHLPRLYNAVRDVRAFAVLLQDKYQFSPEYTTLLFDQDATRKKIYQTLDRLVQVITPQDNLVLYFSGHGEFREQMDEAYWIPVDAERDAFFDFIPNQQIQHYLKRINSHHSFVVVDSCFSGALFTSRNLGPAERIETVPSRWLLTSGRKELVSDGKPGDHSPFAENLLLFLKQNQQSSLPISHLINYVIHATATNTGQTPRGEPIQQDPRHKGGEFYFHLKRDEARDWVEAQRLDKTVAYQNFLALYPAGAYAEEAWWALAVKADDIRTYLDYLDRYPAGPHQKMAESRVVELEDERDWQEALRKESVLGYRQYKQRHEKGKYLKVADTRIQSLLGPQPSPSPLKPKLEPTPTPPPPLQSPDQWKRIKQILIIALPLIVLGIVIWQLAGPATKPNVWVCEEHYEQCQKIESPKGIYYLIQDGLQWGYANEKGEVLIPLKFQKVHPFDSNGLALVKKNGKYGWIDTLGMPKIPVEYEFAALFADGKAKVKKSGEVFFIDPQGRRIQEEKPKVEPTKNVTKEPGGKTEPKPEPPPAFSSFKMVFVQGGTFTMGCTSEQGSDCINIEKPAHQVTVSDFNIGKFEVTQAEWKSVMGYNTSTFTESDSCPVGQVSWIEVQGFIKKLNLQTRMNYRLPTEAEWEYAARGGKNSVGFKYAGSNNLDEIAWCEDNSKGKSHLVGEKKPNELGIYDMSGNMWEWCADWNGNYPSEAQTNPKGPNSGVNRILRGGSWYGADRFCRVSFRMVLNPGGKNHNLGFRLAQD